MAATLQALEATALQIHFPSLCGDDCRSCTLKVLVRHGAYAELRHKTWVYTCLILALWFRHVLAHVVTQIYIFPFFVLCAQSPPLTILGAPVFTSLDTVNII